MKPHLFIAGVPATGKSWLGSWLAEHSAYIHIDAERNDGDNFDNAGVHAEWNLLVQTGRAPSFVAALERLGRPVVVNWGFPTRFLYIVSALQAEGVETWWMHAPRDRARRAFVTRGEIHPDLFDRQMDDIEREWLLISSVFAGRIVTALAEDGTQRRPEEMWAEICSRLTSR